MLKIRCKNNSQTLQVSEGATLLQVLESLDFKENSDLNESLDTNESSDAKGSKIALGPVLGAKVDNVVEGLRFKLFNNHDVEFLDYSSYSGRGIYCRSLCFLLYKAAEDLFPNCKLKIMRPISKGYFCRLEKFDEDGSSTGMVTAADVASIRDRMREIVKANAPFRRFEVPTDEAIGLFEKLGRSDTVKLLSSCGKPYTVYHSLEGTPDIFYEALLPSAGELKVWSLEPYRGGMFLRVPDRHSPSELAPFFEQPKTFEALKESLRWNGIMGLENVGDVNLACAHTRATELIQVSEALQEKKIVQMAEEIFRRYHSHGVRIVLITGPSSSGKTTVCKRLSIQLKACGLHPISFSTDDYFVNRLDTPLLPDGNFDFDNFDTVDHAALQDDIVRLLNGETVQVPEYNFVTGIREYNGKTLTLDKGCVLLVEGIHALNPALTDRVPEDAKFRIFINAITSITLDDHNSIATSDNRLLRRIVRDNLKGAYTPLQTITNWPNVRRAEVKWIYPYQEMADVLFNSAYLVEFAVLRPHAEKILSTVPKNSPEYSEASRLLKLLSYFTPVDDRDVPSTSLLRSFIGGGNL